MSISKNARIYGVSHAIGSALLIGAMLVLVLFGDYLWNNLPAWQIVTTGICMIVLIAIAGEWMENAWYSWIEPMIDEWIDEWFG